jgi:flagellar basal-body rod protein FlgB
MSTQDISLFKALGAKMDYLGVRQRVIAQNISNADTPGYRPQDLTKVDFGYILRRVSGDPSVRLETTDPQHMPNPNEVEASSEDKQKHMYEIAPAGNAVIMEEQLLNSNKVNMDYALMTNLYQKNVSMIRLALGR